MLSEAWGFRNVDIQMKMRLFWNSLSPANRETLLVYVREPACVWFSRNVVVVLRVY